MSETMPDLKQRMHQGMFNAMREVLGSGYVKEHYINTMTDFVEVAEW